MRAALVTLLAACAAPMRPTPSDVDAIAARYYDAFTNSDPHLTRDGRVVFVSNRDGIDQADVGDLAHPGAPPVHLPTGNQRDELPNLLPDGTLLYLSDVSSDQKFHVFHIALDGSAPTDLTPGDELRRESLQVARTSGRFAYTGHVLGDQSTHVFVQDVGEPPREVFRDDQVGFVSDITADGAHVLLIRALSDDAQIALSIDVATGSATRLYPPEGETAAIADAEFTADGRGAFVETDHAGPGDARAALRSRRRRARARYDEHAAPLAASAGVQPSPAGDRVIARLEVGEHTELRVLDANDLHLIASPPLPLGEVGVASFSADGQRAGVALRGTSGPGDIAVLDLSSFAFSPLRDEPRAGLGAPPRTSVEKLTAFDGKTVPVNVYLPAASGRLPTLVLVHGGPSSSAKIVWSSTIGFWTAMGFAVVAPNIRGSAGFGIDYMNADNKERRGDALRDMETVNQWARAQPWCDGNRIVIGGISYGGYMTLLALARQPRLWAAGIDGSGMSNLVTMEQLEDQQIRAFDDTEFGVLGKDDALLREWSPITRVADIARPVFVYQGVHGDPVTPQHEADQIVDALHARNVPVEYMLVENEGHGVSRRWRT